MSAGASVKSSSEGNPPRYLISSIKTLSMLKVSGDYFDIGFDSMLFDDAGLAIEYLQRTVARQVGEYFRKRLQAKDWTLRAVDGNYARLELVGSGHTLPMVGRVALQIDGPSPGAIDAATSHFYGGVLAQEAINHLHGSLVLAAGDLALSGYHLVGEVRCTDGVIDLANRVTRWRSTS